MAGDVSADFERVLSHDEAGLVYTSIGGGAGASQELVTFFQGNASTSRKITSSADPGAGFEVASIVSPLVRRAFNEGSSSPQLYDSEEYVARRCCMYKVFLSDGQDLNSPGLRVGLGGPATSRRDTLLFDDGTINNRYVGTYPATRSWVIQAVNVGQFIDPGFDVTTAGGGDPILLLRSVITGVTSAPGSQFGKVSATASLVVGAAKSENLFLDAVDVSDGLYITGGTQSPVAPAVFFDFVDFDEGTISNRIGHAIQQEGIIYFLGTMGIGLTGANASPSSAPVQTYFEDSNAVVVWPQHYVAPGWSRILINLEDPATQVIWNDCVHTSQGIGRRTVDFGATHDVDATNDRVNIGIPGHFENGDIVEYRVDHISSPSNIGLMTNPLTNSDPQYHYYFVAENASGEYSFYDVFEVGGSGNSEVWLEALTDNRGFNLVQLTAASDSPEQRHRLRFWNDERPDLTVQATASPSGSLTINGGTYENFRYWKLAPEVTVNGSSIIGVSRIDQLGATFDGAVFSDPLILPLDENNAMMNCDNPSAIIDCVFGYLSENSNEGHALRITEPGTYTFVGNSFPGGWGADGSNTAMILNDSGGLVTLNITDAANPTVKNAANSPENVTVINNNVSVTLTNIEPLTEIRVYLAEDFNSPIDTNQLAGIEDTGSPSEFTFSAAAGTVVDIVVHNVQYLLPPNNRIKNFTVPTSSTSFPISQILDKNFRNP